MRILTRGAVVLLPEGARTLITVCNAFRFPTPLCKLSSWIVIASSNLPPGRESPNETRKALLVVLEPTDVAKDSEVQKSKVSGANVLAHTVSYTTYIHTSCRGEPLHVFKLVAAGGVVGPLESGQVSWCNFAAPKPPYRYDTYLIKFSSPRRLPASNYYQVSACPLRIKLASYLAANFCSSSTNSPYRSG